MGARHKATVAAEALLDGEAEALTRKAVEMALAGDGTALRLCLDRIIPPRRERPVRFTAQRGSGGSRASRDAGHPGAARIGGGGDRTEFFRSTRSAVYREGPDRRQHDGEVWSRRGAD